jgi:hypothetical protein
MAGNTTETIYLLKDASHFLVRSTCIGNIITSSDASRTLWKKPKGPAAAASRHGGNMIPSLLLVLFSFFLHQTNTLAFHAALAFESSTATSRPVRRCRLGRWNQPVYMMMQQPDDPTPAPTTTTTPPNLVASTNDPPHPPFTSWNDLLNEKTRSGISFGSIPRFVEFGKHHERLAMELSGGERTHIPNLLQGGKTTGPIVKTKVGQVVRLAALYPDLAAQPRHDLGNGNDDSAAKSVFQHDKLSWVLELQQRLPAIREEVRRVAPTLSESTWTSLRTRRGQDWSDSTGWAHLALIDNFRFQDEQLLLFPETMRILQEVVGTERRMGPRLTAIARQKANSGIPEHVDFMNWMLTLHTVLWGPKERAGIVVNGIRKDWTVGDPVVMDTTYLHHTYNESQDEDLYLLMVDFWHPDLSVDEIDALRSFFAANSGV